MARCQLVSPGWGKGVWHKELIHDIGPPKGFLPFFLQEGIAVGSMFKTVRAGSRQVSCAWTGVFYFPA